MKIVIEEGYITADSNKKNENQCSAKPTTGFLVKEYKHSYAYEKLATKSYWCVKSEKFLYKAANNIVMHMSKKEQRREIYMLFVSTFNSGSVYVERFFYKTTQLTLYLIFYALSLSLTHMPV